MNDCVNNYLIVDSKKYQCKSTYNNTPYMQVNSTNYLDLTTNTNNQELKIKINDIVYRPLQSTTTSYDDRVTVTSTTGYSGVTSRSSTSGYSGRRSTISTTGYSGRTTKSMTRYSGYATSTQSSRITQTYYRGSRSSTLSAIYIYDSQFTSETSRSVYSSTVHTHVTSLTYRTGSNTITTFRSGQGLLH